MADKKPEKEKHPVADDDAVATPEVAPKVRKPLPKMVIIAAVVVVQIIGSYFLQKALFFHDVSAAAPQAKHEEKKEESKGGKHGKEEGSSVVMLDEIVVNPAHTSGRRYLAVTVGFQTALPEADKVFEKNKPLIRDALISLLSSKEMEQLANIAYRDSLKAEIKTIVNRQMQDTAVTQVVFSGYVLQ